MEFLSAQSKYIAQQLRSLSVSQRVAIALLVVILLGGMWGMVQWGRRGEWTELLPQSLTVEEIQQVEAQLALIGVETKVQGDRVLIRGDQDERRRAHAVLLQGQVLPKDISLGYAALVKEDNVWESDQVKRWKQNRALEAELSAVLRRFRGIKDARVLVVIPQRRGIGRRAATSSASVDVTLTGGEVLDKQRILAIANYVAGAVPGLEVKNVMITDGNRSYRAPDASENLATDMLDKQRQLEGHYTQKIYDQLKHIQGVVVNVHAKLRQNDEHREEIKRGERLRTSEKTKEQEMTGASVATGPGVRPNVGRKLVDSGSGRKSSITEEESAYDSPGNESRIDNNKLRGTLELLTASVNVPHSYLLRILEARQPGTTDTSPAAIRNIADVELPKIRDLVKPLIGATDAKDNKLVVVDWYHDLPGEDAAPAAAAQMDVVALAKDYGPRAGLGLLAAFSLFMVFRIAKRAQAVMGGPSLSAAGAGVGVSGGGEGVLHTLGGAAVPVGEAEGMEGVLVGHEVDESMVRTQQIVKQIAQMVGEDPASAASIVDIWLKDEQ